MKVRKESESENTTYDFIDDESMNAKSFSHLKVK